ncbi:hypothetical protein [Bradyrhizobium sp. Mp27]|uniref:hypothetical protein n=1 Tax=Bradyrhizobium sp. Mp27 TaxID=3042157 RepID=UPI00248C5B84|nr:hypothetical protein [Bradyrhizobium sp. Mp27]MDI2076146.1 hypothetical protein [Bradyrhizobium sp. Mp27]
MMTIANAENAQNILASSEVLLKRFVGDAIETVAPLAATCAHRSLLAAIAVLKRALDYKAYVEIHLGDFQQFGRISSAFKDGRVTFEVRPLHSASEFELSTKRPYECDAHDATSRAIFGFVGTYGAICIRRHARLDCLVVQFC